MCTCVCGSVLSVYVHACAYQGTRWQPSEGKIIRKPKQTSASTHQHRVLKNLFWGRSGYPSLSGGVPRGPRALGACRTHVRPRGPVCVCMCVCVSVYVCVCVPTRVCFFVRVCVKYQQRIIENNVAAVGKNCSEFTSSCRLMGVSNIDRRANFLHTANK